ncbi:bromodomain-containing protein DDB_G0270170 [Hydra vulgaris]|uniref:bromodomain-containing protein DDB_G0270170 n=1 Tax=Hydra vulgaris TaxID=6087 RepID=UPI001F5F405D|nr:bromodomain-containing protein DDB_G0270170 [Hydra vulgaris]
MSFLCTSKKKEKKANKKDTEAYKRTTDYDHLQNFFHQEEVIDEDIKFPSYSFPLPQTYHNIQAVLPGQLRSPENSQEKYLEVIKSFFPTLATEISVKRGDIVLWINSDGDWVLIQTQYGDEGYVPRSYCRVVFQNAILKQNYYFKDNTSSYGSNQFYEYETPYHTRPRQFTHFVEDRFSPRTHLNSLDTSSSSSETSSYWNVTERFDSLRSNESISSWSSSSYKPVCGRKCGKKCEHQRLINNKSQCKLRPQVLHTPKEEKTNKNNNFFFEKSDQEHDGSSCSDYTSIKSCLLSCGHPELIVIESYEKQGNTDISVVSGDFASIINDTKYEDWIYIRNESGERGFVPTQCVLKHQCEECGFERNYLKEKQSINRSDREIYSKRSFNVVGNSDQTNKYNEKEEENQNNKTRTVDTNNDNTKKTREKEKHFSSITDVGNNQDYTNKSSESEIANPAKIQSKLPIKTNRPKLTDNDIKKMNKMIVISNFAGSHLEDLYVCIGDFVYVDKTTDMTQNLIWVHSIKQNLSGYVPSTVIRAVEDIDVKADV